MNWSRRSFLTLLFALPSLLASTALADPGRHRHPHKPRRRRLRRRVRRRRIRRRARWRLIAGRRRLVVPLAIAVGWELAVDDRIVVVKEVHTTTVVVENADGTTSTLDVVKEDTEENGAELEGSEYEVESDEP